ncbi:MAG: 3-oxoacyl-ACP synthase [Planctomycetes bacterium GWF2_41_51]|nr:MAG: 3-oxoacyl-ACP synthase [Planctomycetes bacterium GWF2_41_51]
MNNTKISDSAFRAVIAGTGSFIPEKQLTNEDLTKMVDTNDEWITTRTGIKVRHIASDNQSTALLATEAAKKAIQSAKISPEDIEMIVTATVTPEMVFPSTACFVQEMLGAKKAWAFDISAACSGFVYGLSIAQHFVISGKYDNVLVIGAETLSKITDYKDRKSCILFGDGAGAAVIKRGNANGSRGIIYSTSGSDGAGWTALNCPAYGSRNPVSKPLENPNSVFMQINGREVYQLAVRKIIETVENCMENCNMSISDVDLFIPHQMNARIIESVAKRLELADEKVFINIDKYGNTSAASIPIALDECMQQGRIKKGDIVLLVAFGGGLTWGANVIEF